MIIRPVRNGDLKRVDEIYRCYHEDKISLPNLHNQITSAVVEANGNVIGFGVVNAFAEAMMILDLHERKVDRLQAMNLLMREAIHGCSRAQVERLHVAIHDTGLEKILKKHYGYANREGTVLYREI